MKKTGLNNISISHKLRGGGYNYSVGTTPIFDWRIFLWKFKGAGRFLTGLFFCALFSIVLSISPAPLGAQEPPPEAAVQAVRIVTDQERGTVTIVIDGEPAVIIDKTGLYVVGDMAYGGTLTDTGSAWIKSRIEEGDSARDSKGGTDGKK